MKIYLGRSIHQCQCGPSRDEPTGLLERLRIKWETYLKNLNYIFLANVEDALDVTRDGNWVGNLCSCIQHMEYFIELIIFHNVERVMTVCTPHGKKIPKPSGGVCWAVCECRELLRLWGVRWITFACVDDDASGLMCTANTKTNTKQMRGVQGKRPIRPVYEMRWKPTKADEACTSRTTHRHSVCSDNTGNSRRTLCEHSGTHADTRHSVGEAGGYAGNTGR